MPCNLILDRLVKVSWQAWLIFVPHQLWPVQANCRPNVSAFPCRLCQFWPLPAVACPAHADHLCFLLFFLNFGPGQPRPGQAGLALWPQLPRFFYPLANMALTPVYPGLAVFLMQGKCCVVTDGAADIVVVPLGFFTWLVYICTYCLPIATLNQNKWSRLLYLGDAQITMG